MSSFASIAYCDECLEAKPATSINQCCDICGSTIVDTRVRSREEQARRHADEQRLAHQQIQAIIDDSTATTGSAASRRGRPSAEELSQLVQALAAAGAGVLPIRGGTVPLNDATGGGGMGGDMWETPPEEAMNPQPPRNSSRPVSKAVLDRIPIIAVNERSAILHESTLKVTFTDADSKGGDTATATASSTLNLDCVVAEFGPHSPYNLDDLSLIAADPIIGRSSSEPLTNASSLKGKIAVFRRGGNVTFAMKGVQAMKAGALGVVVIQDQGIWP
jgi:hypothetical protein